MRSCLEFQLCGRVGKHIVLCERARRAWNHGLAVHLAHTWVDTVAAFILSTPTETLQSVTISRYQGSS